MALSYGSWAPVLAGPDLRSSVWTFLLISLQRQYRRPESLPQHAWLRALTLLACSLVTGVAWRSHKYRRLRIGRVLCAQPGLRTTQEQLRHSSGTGFGTRTAERPHLQSQERHGGGGEGRLVGEGASSGLSGLLTWSRFQQEEINPPLAVLMRCGGCGMLVVGRVDEMGDGMTLGMERVTLAKLSRSVR